jgi:transposase
MRLRVCRLGDFTRVANSRRPIAYFGLVPGESSCGEAVRGNSITKTGNGRPRRAVIKGVWALKTSKKTDNYRFCLSAAAFISMTKQTPYVERATSP